MTQIDPDVLAQSIVDVVDQAVAPLRERLAAVEALAGAAARHDDATVATLRDTCANLTTLLMHVRERVAVLEARRDEPEPKP